jgi:hypothetical protein
MLAYLFGMQKIHHFCEGVLFVFIIEYFFIAIMKNTFSRLK